MNLLIIGASGFIGGNVLAHARRAGLRAAGTSFSAQRPGLLRFDMLRDDIRPVIPRDFLEGAGACAVLCSAVSRIDACWAERERSYALNVLGTIKTLAALKELGIKTAFLSSEAVFDGERGYYNEDSPTSPVNEYGKYKVAVEKYMLSDFPESLILRLSMVVADTPGEDHLFAHWHDQISQGQPLVCIAGQIFSPTFVGDVARGIVTALGMDLRGLHHLSNSEYFQREELARQFLYAAGAKSAVVVKPLAEFNFPEPRALKTYLDGSRFARTADIRFTSMREVIAALMLRTGLPRP